jgi:DNA-binding transcriptional MerR regulator
MAIRPIDIARKLGISTTTLRKYEEFDLVPPVSRSSSGYRVYTNEHIAYFICVKEMMAGFDLSQIAKILKEVMAKKTDIALWMANKAQADLQQEKKIFEKIVSNLGCIGDQKVKQLILKTNHKLLTINDVSRETGVPATTIRHWDKVGLISSQRCTENNYRMFSSEHIKQILTIYALKLAFQAKHHKHFINLIKEELKEFGYNDKNRILGMKYDIENYLNKVNRAQISSIAALYYLCIQVDRNHFENYI